MSPALFDSPVPVQHVYCSLWPYSVASPQLFLWPCSWPLHIYQGSLSHLSSWSSWCSLACGVILSACLWFQTSVSHHYCHSLPSHHLDHWSFLYFPHWPSSPILLCLLEKMSTVWLQPSVSQPKTHLTQCTSSTVTWKGFRKQIRNPVSIDQYTEMLSGSNHLHSLPLRTYGMIPILSLLGVVVWVCIVPGSM